MKGQIYTEDRCPCGGRMLDDGKRLICQAHGYTARSKFYVKFGRGVKQRFKTDEGCILPGYTIGWDSTKRLIRHSKSAMADLIA